MYVNGVLSPYMQTHMISARDIQRNYKAVVDRVKHTKQPAILMSQKEPQAVIVSVEDFEKLQEMRKRNSARAALSFAKEVRALLKDENLPADLSTRHDYYLWEEQP
jgi:prevent-host-death family protein